MSTTNELNMAILNILKTQLKYSHDEYIKAIAHHASQAAGYGAFEQNRDPYDGVGGWQTDNPYNVDSARDRLDKVKIAYLQYEEIYEHAIKTFIIGKENE
jgi:hypothetical protein